MSSSRRHKPVDSKRTAPMQEDGGIANAPRLRIEPGEYDAICYGVEVGTAWSRKCFVLFRIYEGKYDGVELFMACSYPAGKLSLRLKLYTQWTLAIGRNPYKGERFSQKVFKGKMFTVHVQDTKRKFPGTNKSMPDHCQYSIVCSIIDVQTGIADDH